VRDASGEGQFIDVSLFEAGVSFSVWEAGKYFATGEIPRPQGSAHQNNAPYQAVRSQDGWFTVGANSPRTWPAFCEAVGLEHLQTDSRYADTNTRFEHRAELIAAIEEVTVTRPTDHWIELLQSAGVPCSPIQDYAEVYSDPHLLARGYFWDAPHPTIGTVRQLGSPMRFSSTQVRQDRAGPLFGEDSEAVLRELGMTEDEIAALVAKHVILTPDDNPARPAEART